MSSPAATGVWRRFLVALGLTIGYGDIVPRQTFTRALAIVIGFGAVNVMRATLTDGDKP